MNQVIRTLACLASIMGILYFFATSCSKNDELIIERPNPKPLYQYIQDSLGVLLSGHLDSLESYPFPDPGQLNLLSDNEEILDDTIICRRRVFNGTSGEHESLMVPNPNSPFESGKVYDLSSILDGGYSPIVEGIGGTRFLTAIASSWADTITTTPESTSVGVSMLQSKIPPDRGNNDMEILIEDAYSARQISAHFGATYNSLFFDFATEVDYANSQYNYTYLAIVKVINFSVRVKPPAHPIEWYPNLTDYSLFGQWAPVYASRVDYGKLMIMKIETNYSKSDLEASLDASFEGVFSGGEFDASGTYATLKQNSKIRIQAFGGNLESIIGLLDGGRSGIAQYLRELDQDKTGAMAVPLFTEFRFLKDNSVAKVVLATDDYIVRDCRPVPTGNYTINKPIYYYLSILPQLVQGNNTFGHHGYRVDMEAQLFSKNKREVWASLRGSLREAFGNLSVSPQYGDTRAIFDKEFLIDNTTVPSNEEIIELPEEITISFWIPPISHDSGSTFETYVNHGTETVIDRNSGAILIIDGDREFTGFIRQVTGNSGHDGADFPAADDPTRNFLRVYLNNFPVRTKVN